MDFSLTSDELQILLSRSDLQRLDKLLLMLFWENKAPKSISRLKEIAEHNGLRETLKWNISDILARGSKGKATLIKKEWSITATGVEYLKSQNLLQEKKITPSVVVTMEAQHEPIDVAIIAALYDDEFTSLKDFLMDEKSVPGFETLMTATLKGSKKRVLVDFQTRMGMVEATYLSTQILAKFSPKYLIMVGVCGGRSKKDVKLLDIIVPNKVFDYQSGKYDNGQFKPYLRVCNINNKKTIAAKAAILRSMEDYVAAPLKSKCKHIVVHSKTMACGNVVVKTDGYLENAISAFDEETVGVEMESFGVVRTTELIEDKKVTPIIIKSVMDYTEKGKNDNEKQTAAYFSACFTYFLVKDHL